MARYEPIEYRREAARGWPCQPPLRGVSNHDQGRKKPIPEATVVKQPLGMTTYNDVENEGTYLPFGDRDGGELQLVFPDFGNCFQSQTGERLVSIELQFARTTDICSAIFFGPY
jgi:hypothetical protein